MPSSQAEYDACVASVPKPASMTPSAAGTFRPDLAEVDSNGVAATIRESLKNQMRAQVEQSRYQAIVGARCESLRPKPDNRGGTEDAVGAAPSPGASFGSKNEGDQGGQASQVSTTNNQIAGVDEADFIKNDNKYIYVVKGNKFRIIEAWPAATAHEIASVEIKGTAKKLFVSNGHALVYASVPRVVDASSGGSSNGAASGPAFAPSSGSNGCSSYGYDCTYTGDGTATVLSIFDIANVAQPTLLRTIETSSSLVAARRIGDTVHTVFAEEPFNGSSYWTSYVSSLPAKATEADVNAAYDKLLADNDARIEKVDVSNVLPRLASVNKEPQRTVFQSLAPDGAAFTTLLSFDMASDGAPMKAVTVISRPGAVFASADSLYMAVPHERGGWGWYDGRAENEVSTVHKFSIGTSALTTNYHGSGVVKGRVLNQFAMDEKDGKLRIATTSGHLPSPDAENTLSILEEQAGGLNLIGQIDHIAKTEDIRSVRFDGDHGYMVTFKKTDPLYVFDLSNPYAPTIQGELKIPGFSVYMHLMDPTHLLTIGYDASDQGDFAWFTGVILQIFDVSNPADPKLTHKESIGTRGSSSEALADHLAFNYFAPKNILAIPMTICEGGNQNGGYGTNMTFSGLMVYDVTAAGGFSLRGKVAHPTTKNPSESSYYDSSNCSNWWANASSEVKRSIVMDDYVFSVSDRRIKANELDSLSTDVKDLSIE